MNLLVAFLLPAAIVATIRTPAQVPAPPGGGETKADTAEYPAGREGDGGNATIAAWPTAPLRPTPFFHRPSVFRTTPAPDIRLPAYRDGFFCRFERRLGRRLPVAVDLGTD